MEKETILAELDKAIADYTSEIERLSGMDLKQNNEFFYKFMINTQFKHGLCRYMNCKSNNHTEMKGFIENSQTMKKNVSIVYKNHWPSVDKTPQQNLQQLSNRVELLNLLKEEVNSKIESL